MYEEKYEEAINKIKETYPHLKDIRFTIENGELGWWYESKDVNYVDIKQLQLFVNDFLGQKLYRTEYIGYMDTYARSEEEAREFTKELKPYLVINKITQVEN